MEEVHYFVGHKWSYFKVQQPERNKGHFDKIFTSVIYQCCNSHMKKFYQTPSLWKFKSHQAC